jgi:hypothetical protein
VPHAQRRDRLCCLPRLHSSSARLARSACVRGPWS